MLIFPRHHLDEIDSTLRQQGPFSSWTADPVRADEPNGGELALKYYGHCEPVSSEIQGELQIVPMLIGLFWQVEHAVLYKPRPELKGLDSHPEMGQRNREVLRAFRAFEETFERLVRQNRPG